MSELRIGVLTCSDSRSAGSAEDTSGRALVELAQARGWCVAAYHVVPDDRETIANTIAEMADSDEVDILLTTGGTGLGPRDVCPEATLSRADREVPGIAEALRAESMRLTKRAMLSRGVAAMRGRTLIINFPGSEKAARESFEIVADQLEHAVLMIAGGGHA